MVRLLSSALALVLLVGNVVAEELPSPAPQKDLRPMLRVTWERGPNLPQGFQDSDGGFLGKTLITVGGFCSGGLKLDNEQKPGKYPRGFLNKAWGLNEGEPNATWERLPDFPGAPRQGLMAVRLGNDLGFWGGFSYDAPYTFRDGWRLSRSDGKWTWSPLPDLPHPLTTSGMCEDQGKVYLFGGADYDGQTGFFTERDRSGGVARLGARLYVWDSTRPEGNWQRLPDCPGTPRFVHAVQLHRGALYVLGGATGDLKQGDRSYGYCSVVDNWKFDLALQTWSRLRDLPVSSGNFPKSVNLIFQDRYILLPGGHQYDYLCGPDGVVRPKYGRASRKRPESGLHNDLFVYDMQTDLFGTADPLPIDNNLPTSLIRGDRMYLMGGETGGGVVDGEYYGHHPDLLLIGKISVLK